MRCSDKKSQRTQNIIKAGEKRKVKLGPGKRLRKRANWGQMKGERLSRRDGRMEEPDQEGLTIMDKAAKAAKEGQSQSFTYSAI